MHQRAQLHDERHLTGDKGFTDADGRNQSKCNQYVRLDVKRRHKSNGRLQKNGDAAQKEPVRTLAWQ